MKKHLICCQSISLLSATLTFSSSHTPLFRGCSGWRQVAEPSQSCTMVLVLPWCTSPPCESEKRKSTMQTNRRHHWPTDWLTIPLCLSLSSSQENRWGWIDGWMTSLSAAEGNAQTTCSHCCPWTHHNRLGSKPSSSTSSSQGHNGKLSLTITIINYHYISTFCK